MAAAIESLGDLPVDIDFGGYEDHVAFYAGASGQWNDKPGWQLKYAIVEFDAEPGQWLPGRPLVVLVDRRSASAAEVLAGALQDHQRALIVGERTFGKGSVQSVLPLRGGGGIKLTTALYYTPSGRSIQAEGIVPDIEIALNESPGDTPNGGREADLAGHLPTGQGEAPAAVPGGAGESRFPLEEIMAVLGSAGLLAGESDDDIE